MYFPKNKIETNLYSNGDFIVKSTSKIYYGLYFKTSNGLCYTGEEPSNTSLRLIALNESPDALDSTSEYDLRFIGKNYNYSILTNQPLVKSNIDPIPFTPNPTKEDYKKGNITRSFVKKTNENIYYEVENPSFFTNPIYFIFRIPWLITGDKEWVYSQNKLTVSTKISNLNLTAFNKFLKNDYLKFWKPS